MSACGNPTLPRRRRRKGPNGHTRAINYEAWMSPADRREFLTLVANFGPRLVGYREREFWLGKIRAAEEERERYQAQGFHLPTINEEGPENAQDCAAGGSQESNASCQELGVTQEHSASQEHSTIQEEERAAQAAKLEAIDLALKAIDLRLDELDPPPDTNPLNPASFSSVNDYKDAFFAQVDAICKFLPTIDDKFLRNLPSHHFKEELQALVHWWAPRLVEVSNLGEEALADFWRRFKQVMDLWKVVPFFNEDGQRYPSEHRCEVLAGDLLKLATQGKPRALALDPRRIGTPWTQDFDLDFHREYLSEAHSRAYRAGWKQEYYTHKRWRSVADHLIDKRRVLFSMLVLQFFLGQQLFLPCLLFSPPTICIYHI
ncbi:hypothetical protein MD484_g6467, partial [Candolleomyces efflorescens]